MPRGYSESDIRLETIYKIDKYYPGQILKRYGKTFVVTRIVEVKTARGEKTYDVYGKQVE